MQDSPRNPPLAGPFALDKRAFVDWMYGAVRARCVVPRTREAGHMKRGSKLERDPKKLASQLEQLRELNPEQIREQWRILFGAEPPPTLHGSLLVQGIAYRLQEKALGGLKPATVRLLEQIADDAAGRRQLSATPQTIRLNPGTMLILEWHGTQHQMSVLEDGFLYRAKRYSSLSQIARTITGSRWSGPLFFGLKANRQEKVDGAI